MAKKLIFVALTAKEINQTTDREHKHVVPQRLIEQSHHLGQNLITLGDSLITLGDSLITLGDSLITWAKASSPGPKPDHLGQSLITLSDSLITLAKSSLPCVTVSSPWVIA